MPHRRHHAAPETGLPNTCPSGSCSESNCSLLSQLYRRSDAIALLHIPKTASSFASFVWAYGCPEIPACALRCSNGFYAMPQLLAYPGKCSVCCPLLYHGNASIYDEFHHRPHGATRVEASVGLLRHPAARVVSAFRERSRETRTRDRARRCV